MNREPYKRKQGEFELRVLKDGRLVMIAPDETLLEIGQTVEQGDDPTPADADRQDVENADPTDQEAPR